MIICNGKYLHQATNGDLYWFKEGHYNSFLHREDGPAIEYFNGSKTWYLNGKLHRLDGPAVEAANGDKYWWINGQNIPCKTQKEFEQLMRLRAFW
jgi:hypothetical protein